MTLGTPHEASAANDVKIWDCPFRIDGLDEGPIGHEVVGIDAFEALANALVTIGAHLGGLFHLGNLDLTRVPAPVPQPSAAPLGFVAPPAARGVWRCIDDYNLHKNACNGFSSLQACHNQRLREYHDCLRTRGHE